MKLNKIVASFLFAGMLILSGCGSSDSTTTTPPPTDTTPPTDTPAPDNPSAPVTNETRVTTTSGETIAVQVTTEGFRFAGFEGKPTVLEFYGDTCPHCIESIPTYNKLQATYGDKVLILTINDGNQYTTLDNAGMQGFVNSNGIGYRTAARENSGNMRSYAEGFVGTMGGVPYVIIINGDGVITNSILGPNEAQLEAAIADVL